MNTYNSQQKYNSKKSKRFNIYKSESCYQRQITKHAVS